MFQKIFLSSLLFFFLFIFLFSTCLRTVPSFPSHCYNKVNMNELLTHVLFFSSNNFFFLIKRGPIFDSRQTLNCSLIHFLKGLPFVDLINSFIFTLIFVFFLYISLKQIKKFSAFEWMHYNYVQCFKTNLQNITWNYKIIVIKKKKKKRIFITPK